MSVTLATFQVLSGCCNSAQIRNIHVTAEAKNRAVPKGCECRVEKLGHYPGAGEGRKGLEQSEGQSELSNKLPPTLCLKPTEIHNLPGQED